VGRGGGGGPERSETSQGGGQGTSCWDVTKYLREKGGEKLRAMSAAFQSRGRSKSSVRKKRCQAF